MTISIHAITIPRAFLNGVADTVFMVDIKYLGDLAVLSIISRSSIISTKHPYARKRKNSSKSLYNKQLKGLQSSLKNDVG